MAITSGREELSVSEVARLRKRLSDLEMIAKYRASALEDVSRRVEELTEENARLTATVAALNEANRNLRKTITRGTTNGESKKTT